MVLNKQLKELKVQTEYKKVVERFVELTKELFGPDLHSLYLCGSVARGEAVAGKSDMDTTIVVSGPSKSYYMESINHIKDVIMAENPGLLSKVDIAICSKNELFIEPYEWGFWIKIISVCIYGEDLGESLVEIEPSKALIIALNKGTLHVIRRIRVKIAVESDDKERIRLRHSLTKRLIRAMYTLILDKTGSWSDDFDEIRDDLYTYFPKEEDKIRALFYYLNNDESSLEEYLSRVYGVEKFIQSELEKL